MSLPPPIASGEALKTVEQHQASQDLVFYAGWYCPHVQRAWVTLEEKGIPYQYKETNPYLKEESFLKVNPNGLIPAALCQGTSIYESLILCEFFEENFPDHKSTLLPSDALTRATARIWMDYTNKALFPANFALLQAASPDDQAASRAALVKAVKEFAEQIKGPYF